MPCSGEPAAFHSGFAAVVISSASLTALKWTILCTVQKVAEKPRRGGENTKQEVTEGKKCFGRNWWMWTWATDHRVFLSRILFQVYLEFAAKGAWVVGAPWCSVSVDESVNLQKKVGDASTSAWSLWWRNLGPSDLSGPLHTCACGKHNINPTTFRLTAQRV